MREPNNIDLRSEEVQEILGTPPGWMVRWGTTMALVTVVILGWVGYWVRYPDVVETEIKITSMDPPKRLVAGTQAYISKILVQNEDTVGAGQTLIVFKNKANLEDVHTLADRLTRVRVMTDSTLLAFDPGRDLLLGELQDAVYDFLVRQEKLRLLNLPRYERLNVRQILKERSSLRSSIQYDRDSKEKLAGQIDLAYQRLRQEENLLRENSVDYATVRNTRAEILGLEREMQSIESSIKTKEFQIESMGREISGARADSRESRVTALTELKESFHTLKNQVEDWKKKYLIVSPIDGIAIIPSDKIGEQQFVTEGAELMVVVPLKKSETIGKIDLNINGSGKVQPGQRVIVKLESYPFHEFGALIGKVEWKGRIASGSTIPIDVSFPNGLITTTNRQIDPSREMTGSAEIITENKRFIERIFENFRTVPY